MFKIGDEIPRLGLLIPIRISAVNVPLKIDVLGIVKLDFKGSINFRVQENIFSHGFDGAKMAVYMFDVSADSPVLGKVTMTKNYNINTTPLCLIEPTENLPPTLRNTNYLNVELTIEKPPGGGPPLVLSNTKPIKLLNDNLPQFPPQSSVYQLQEPVDLAPVGAPNQVVAQLQQFPVTMSFNWSQLNQE